MSPLFEVKVEPDWQGLIRCIRREGSPSRVYYMELFLDPEIKEAICERFDLTRNLNRSDPFFEQKREIILQRFLGYDTVRCSLEGMEMPLHYEVTRDSAELERNGGRQFVNLQRGPITNWEEFEKYAWPDPYTASTRLLEWYEENLPDNMCITASGGFAHFAEYLSWLMGYENLCLALHDNRELVAAISSKLVEMYRVVTERLLRFEKVKIIFGSDDMGFRSSTLISPDDLREFVLPGHKIIAEMAHAAGRPYLLHSCGKLDLIMEDLIEDVRIDAKHSFEDTIIPVTEFYKEYGDRVGVLGGIDVDFLCRSSEDRIRERVRYTLSVCQPNGGYCLGTGNSVANYIPVDHYLVMLDEGRKFCG